MPSALEAQTALRHLAAEAKSVTTDTTLTTRQKSARLGEIETKIADHQETIKMSLVEGRLMSGGSSLYGDSSGYGGYDDVGGQTYGLPSLRPTSEQTKALHFAAVSKQGLLVDVSSAPALAVTKAALDLEGNIPATLMPGIIAFRRDPTRVASLFPSTAVSSPVIEYIRHTGNTGVAATVLPGGVKPEIVPSVDTVTATMRKIAAHIGVNDETLLDFASTSSYLTMELTQAIFAAENTQLLSGNGTAPNLQGVLNVSGVLTRTQAAAPETAIDSLELALNDLRVGSSFTEATGFVMNPNDWSAIRLLKNSYGEYLLGHPAESDGLMLWGKPVVLTTNIAAKTVLVGDFATGGQVMYRQGITVQAQSAGTDWTSNVTRFRAEERLTLAVFRPSCFVRVTLS